ncbi:MULTISPECIES: DUF4194 domain-containing protein [Burkholderia]|uniref:DUF4194 domain-containing protein n=1 Tax=Burkholderia anthinoferrum TaxID=3090833 RepID=A0ABU5WP28_9BURK|nr:MULTISPECIES: DUF4194 domain-containing protein [Burkholderia]MEB2507609.1 DUF4194 domain-containing protein [Burkholderia anthinoferrum]MEB2531082.1 DUF4194 domain-containing protein [Burkholderia anthinoferrum]MEB2564649.1 DUF4194 domain-containing protein [Burkholderia anthinoferrum]MEB2580168.1 DUF4194 domain-containing protein [Burkholderia anthinoferrum]KVH03690.1 hypothetical protein WS85_31500 [Burkholderia anthina]
MVSIFDTLTASKDDGREVDKVAQLSGAHDEASEFDAGPSAEAASFTSRDVKDACQELLKFGLLEVARKPNLYRITATSRADIDRILEPLDLVLKIDDIRGLAFVSVAQSYCRESEDDEWSHPLVRRQRLTLEQSLLVALLRQRYLAHEQERGIGVPDAPALVEDVAAQLQLYLGGLGSDTRELQRARNLLDKLKPHGVVSEVDQQDQFMIRPIIVHLANPENLLGLLQALKQASPGIQRTDDCAPVGDDGEIA